MVADGSEEHSPLQDRETMTYPGNRDEDETQEQRALQHISAIANGADITEQARDLSDDFTDRFVARMRDWFARRRD
jgi:hypothetical protein